MYPSGSDGQINQRSVEEKIEQETERNHALHEAFYDAQMVHDEIESKLIKARRHQQELENECDAAIDGKNVLSVEKSELVSSIRELGEDMIQRLKRFEDSKDLRNKEGKSYTNTSKILNF